MRFFHPILLLSSSSAFLPTHSSRVHKRTNINNYKQNAFTGTVRQVKSEPVEETKSTAVPQTEASKREHARTSSFEDAQVIGDDLAAILTKSCANGEPMPEEATLLLRDLVSTTSGARGWFVSLLTNMDYDPVFVKPIDESFLSALCDNPEPNIKLMTMNVAMSTATELTHLANGNEDLAAGSRMTAIRSTILVEELMERLPGVRETFEALLSAVDGREDGDKEWMKFCKKWGYGPEQKDAIRRAVEPLLAKQ